MTEKEKAGLKDEIIRFANSREKLKIGKHFIKDRAITTAQFKELVEEISSNGYIKFLPYNRGSHNEDEVQVHPDIDDKGQLFLERGGYSAKFRKELEKKRKKGRDKAWLIGKYTLIAAAIPTLVNIGITSFSYKKSSDYDLKSREYLVSMDSLRRQNQINTAHILTLEQKVDSLTSKIENDSLR